MSSQRYSSTDTWLKRNLHGHDVASESSWHGSQTSNFQLHILPMLLAFSAVIVAVMWYQEARLNLMSAADHVGYPVLLGVTAVGALLLKLRPNTLRAVMAVAFVAYLAHMLTVYYIEMAHRLSSGVGSSYELTILALWLPFGYVGSFVFFSPRIALRTSLAIYAAIALPQWVILATESDLVARQIAFAIVVSQPLYIAALRGVGLLKSHASGVQELARSMSDAASMDALTGIANRRAIDAVLGQVISAQAGAARSVSLLMLDVDHFKRINDTYGHAAGDEVLIKLAHETNTHLRSTDLLGRWGGEEFLIIALDQTGPQALQMAERIRSELARVPYPDVGKVTVSIGVTSFIPGEEKARFVNRADNALYQAKAQGRNRVAGRFENEEESLSS